MSRGRSGRALCLFLSFSVSSTPTSGRRLAGHRGARSDETTVRPSIIVRPMNAPVPFILSCDWAPKRHLATSTRQRLSENRARMLDSFGAAISNRVGCSENFAIDLPLDGLAPPPFEGAYLFPNFPVTISSHLSSRLPMRLVYLADALLLQKYLRILRNRKIVGEIIGWNVTARVC